jgi:hypothetical protein
MNKKEKTLLEYMVKNQGITETQAIIYLGIYPSRLKRMINNFQRNGMLITGDRNFVDFSYHLTKIYA